MRLDLLATDQELEENAEDLIRSISVILEEVRPDLSQQLVKATTNKDLDLEI